MVIILLPPFRLKKTVRSLSQTAQKRQQRKSAFFVFLEIALRHHRDGGGEIGVETAVRLIDMPP
jgi:hypothetical protein